ncbi:hypothetical protein GXM_09574 [Nostoc sphaeroides CCNUC1]|uniref:Uncharacterized protein n=1 Tax=Nostoc sphaeroides CCNUC1 TaxID=2653204 RepID=A0A5P8WHK6_9NOSO|nr:hypothetical protein GXM_09574 [Nostoc sphaeroides CCNUC1]
MLELRSHTLKRLVARCQNLTFSLRKNPPKIAEISIVAY